jgi:hypothetical protein
MAIGAIALLAAGCGTSGGNDETDAASAPAAPTDPAAESGLPETGEYRPGDACEDLAQGPWTNRTTEADLLEGVRNGNAPPFLGESGGLTFEVTEFPTIDDYDDPSTLADPRALYEAWVDAGYQEGIDWRHGDHSDIAALTLVRFRDEGGARAALSALLEDYCGRAVEAKVLDDRSGMTVVRDSEAVRTIFVVDDVVVSVMSCGCYGTSTADRKNLVDDWSAQAMDSLSVPADGTTA